MFLLVLRTALVLLDLLRQGGESGDNCVVHLPIRCFQRGSGIEHAPYVGYRLPRTHVGSPPPFFGAVYFLARSMY